MLDNYNKNEDGIIYQIEKELEVKYDFQYSSKYTKYGDLPTYMGYLRLGNIIGSIGRIPETILDNGYGDGSFLKVCKNIIKECYGNDLSSYPVPDGCIKVNNFLDSFYDVITFFDSLEHFENIEFVKDLNCNYICISVPHCHYFDDEWLKDWKHLRPNEHLWHFDENSLNNFMTRMGYKLLTTSNIEDTIRKNKENEFNILTCVFKKIKV